jgi:hypothetical protein
MAIVTGTFACLSAAALAASVAPENVHDIAKEIRNAFGTAVGDYFYQEGLVAEQIIEGALAWDPTKSLPGGMYLVSGGRPHFGAERSAILVGPDRKVLGAALINYHCHTTIDAADARPNPRLSTDCDDERLTLFLPRVRDYGPQAKALIAWARENQWAGAVEVRIFPDPRAADSFHVVSPPPPAPF